MIRKNVVAGVLVIALQWSVCTGGSFSLLGAAAAYAASYNQAVIMTPADTEVFLCRLFTPSLEPGEVADEHGCDDGEECLSAADAKRDEQLVIVDTPRANGPLIEFGTPSSNKTSLTKLLNEPHHHNAKLLAHILLKRE